MIYWKELLLALESPKLSKETESEILFLWVDDMKAEDTIKDHIQERLKEGISPETLNTVFTNIYSSSDLEGLGETFNNALISPYLHKKYVEHFYHVLNNDTRVLYQNYRKNLLDSLMFHVVHGKSLPVAIEIVNDLIDKTKFNQNQIYVALIHSYMNADKRPLLPPLFDLLGNEVLYGLLGPTAGKEINVFSELIRYADKNDFMSYASSNMTDESALSKAIMTELSSYHLIYYLNNHLNFFKLVFNTSVEKPLLYDFVIDRLIDEKQFHIIIRSAEFQPKKKILKILLAKSDTGFVDAFYKAYKNDPEIKTFLPFT